jgi:hypothetical protein
VVFASTPEPFHRMECWARGGQQHRHNVGRPTHGCGVVPGAMVEYKKMQRMRQGAGQALPPPWERAAVAVWECQKEVGPGRRCACSIQREMVALVRHRGDRLAPAGRQPTAAYGPSAAPGFVLGQDLDRADWRALFQRRGAEGRQGGLKLGHGVGTVLPCEGRGRFGCARRLSRTNACPLAEAKHTCYSSATQTRI